jgi:hypothetical protein
LAKATSKSAVSQGRIMLIEGQGMEKAGLRVVVALHRPKLNEIEIQTFRYNFNSKNKDENLWIPAFAGMTG